MDLQGFCEAGFDLVLVSNVALPHRNPGSIGLQGVQCIIIFFIVRTPDRNFAALGGEAFGISDAAVLPPSIGASESAGEDKPAPRRRKRKQDDESEVGAVG